MIIGEFYTYNATDAECRVWQISSWCCSQYDKFTEMSFKLVRFTGLTNSKNILCVVKYSYFIWMGWKICKFAPNIQWMSLQCSDMNWRGQCRPLLSPESVASACALTHAVQVWQSTHGAVCQTVTFQQIWNDYSFSCPHLNYRSLISSKWI